MRRMVLGAIGTLLIVVGFAEWRVHAVRADYQEVRLSSASSVRMLSLYLPVRQKLIADPGLAIATAFQMSRQPGAKDFVSSMRQAGLGFGLLRQVFLDADAQSEWRNEAAFQALTLLVRMPWDDELEKEASSLSMHLHEALSRDTSATPDERQMIEELHELVAMRQEGRSPMRSHQIGTPADERDVWYRGLQELRLGLASCLKYSDPALDVAWSALARGFGQNWLRREWLSGWDAGLLQTVQASKTSVDCKRLAARVATMDAVAGLSPSQ